MRWLALVALGGCSFSGGASVGSGDGGDGDLGQNPEGEIEYVSASGTVVDFSTGEPVTDITLEGVDLTGGTIDVQGADFEVAGVLPHSIFRLRASSPTHETTISGLITVAEDDVAGITLEMVSSTLLDQAYAASGLTPSGGVLVSRLYDTTNAAPVEGVSSDAFTIGDDVVFLDGNFEVSDVAPASTSAGIALVLNVDPGLVEITSGTSEHSFSAPVIRVESSVSSVVDIEVGADPPEIPTGLSFENDIMPIFAARGCDNCHQGSGPGRQQGGFSLNGSSELRHGEVMLRVNLEKPEDSLLLRKPSFEDPPDGHQIVFANKADPDYLSMLGWIIDGAPLD